MKTISLNTRTAKIPKRNEQELANRIYDTLMKNVDFSPYHVDFNADIVEMQEVAYNVIHLKIAGTVYKIVVTEDDSGYFEEE